MDFEKTEEIIEGEVIEGEVIAEETSECIPVEMMNVLVLGNSGAGKSTLIRAISGAEVESYDDHRIAMAFAVAGTALPPGEELIIRNAECAKVSYPDFIKDFKALGADFSEL